MVLELPVVRQLILLHWEKILMINNDYIVYQHGILRKHRSIRKQVHVICATIVIDYLLLKPFELASINFINAWMHL